MNPSGDEVLISNSSPQRGEEAIQSEQTRTLGVQMRGLKSPNPPQSSLKKGGSDSRHAEEQHLQSAECRLKTQAVCKTFQPNVDTFNANVVIGKRKYPVINSKELSCNKSNYIEINNQLDCFGSKEPHNDDSNSVILSESERSHNRGDFTNDVILRYTQNDSKARGYYHVAHSNNSRKVAFTLAEVLITLGIIGVVAALTLPTLIQNHQKQVYVTQLKKSLSTLQNVVSKIVADEGASDMYATSLFNGMCGNINCEDQYNPSYVDVGDAYGDTSGLEALIPRYIKTVKICTKNECDIKYHSLGRPNSMGEQISSKSEAMYPAYKSVKGFYSNDGMIYYFGFVGYNNYDSSGKPHLDSNSRGLLTCIDVNGEKGPNMKDRDLFCYTYCPNLGEKLLPGSQYICEYPDWSKDTKEYRLMTNGWKMDY